VKYRECIAREKRAAFRSEKYWGKPVPGFGDGRARLLIIGLAPAAHGGNRTGRMFTGDGSADFLIPALYRAGFANRPASIKRNDGFALRDCYMTAVARCAPPDNKPTPQELANCRGWPINECRLLPRVSAVLVLGKIAMDGFIKAMRTAGHPYPPMKFAHGASYPLPCRFQRMFCSYHPSRQNTQTGRLTAKMLDSVLAKIKNTL